MSTPPDITAERLDELVAGIHQNLAQIYAGQPRLEIVQDASAPVIISADTEYLSEALTQVIDNAYRYTPDDGTITITLGRTEAAAWLEVQDTGPGIDEALMPHLFETFWRNDEAHSTPGLGLGLPIAQRIILHHGGDISARNLDGRGMCFRITLPFEQPPRV